MPRGKVLNLLAFAKKRKVLILIIFIFFLAIFFNFFKQEDKTKNLLTQKVSRTTINQSIEAIGMVYAKDEVDVGAQVSGQIIKLYVDIGDRVKKGDLIAQIDKDKQENKKDEQEQQQKKEQEQQKQKQDSQQQQQQQQQNQMSKENAEQLLNAVMQDEKDVQEKVKKQLQMRGKKYDKDW